MRLTENDMQNRRECIIQKAIQMFSDRGIEAVRLAEIAKKSCVSENTIYRYFENKENLVREAFIVLWSTIMSGMDRDVENTAEYSRMTGFEQIQVWIEKFRYFYLFDRDFVIFSYEAKLYLLRHKIKLDKHYQDVMMRDIWEPCLAALNKGKRDGSILSTESSENLFYAIWGTLRGYMTKIIIYDNLYGEDSPWESRYQIVADGILCALRNDWK